MEILGLDWDWVRNKGEPDQRIRHGYDRTALSYGSVSEHE